MSLNSLIFAGITFILTAGILFSTSKGDYKDKISTNITTTSPIITISQSTITKKQASKKVTIISSTIPTPTKIILISPSASLFVQSPQITFTATPTPTSTPIKTALVVSTPTPIALVSTPTPTRIPTETPTPIPSPSQTTTQTPTSVTTQHVFYTSSHWKSKYYYCDTDEDYLTLSEKYKQQFASAELLLAEFPTRVLHEPCK